MAAKDGKATIVGYATSLAASTYGTALDLTAFADAKICCSVTESFSASEVVDDGIGCGSSTGFVTDVKLGQREYRATAEGNLGFQNGFDRILAQFFGAESAPAEQTAGQDDWLHVFKFASLANQRFGTFVWETGTASVIELPSVFWERIQISMEAVQGYVTWSADCVSNTAVFTSPVNTNADLATLTMANPELVFAECVHTFRMKQIADDGTEDALDSGDQFNITSFDLELETPLEVILEMTGGNCSKPSESEGKTGTLTIGLKEHDGNTNTYIPWAAGAFFMAEIMWTGSLIGSGVAHSVKIKLPKLKLVNSPGHAITNPGKNPVTLVMRVLQSVNTMPGYTSKGPEIEIVNQQEAAYLL